MTIAKFVRVDTPIGMDVFDYQLYDDTIDYLSMIPFNKDGLIHNESIIEINHCGNNYQFVKSVDSIPKTIDGYIKS
jgi:hypothetical protein